MVEIEAGAQRQPLGDERAVAPAEQGGQALLGAQRLGAPALARLERDLDGLGPAALGDLLAAAPAQARHQRLLAADLDRQRVRAGNRVGVRARG